MSDTLRTGGRLMAKHRGRFKWKKYSRFKGNLRLYWEAKERMAEHRLEPM